MGKRQKMAELRQKELEYQNTLFSTSSSTWNFKSKLMQPKEEQYSELSGIIINESVEQNSEDDYSDDDEEEVAGYSAAVKSEGDLFIEESSDDEQHERPMKKRKVAWIDDDDQQTKVEEVTKLKGIRGKKMVQMASILDENYQEMLQKKFAAAMGSTPAWADLELADAAREEEDDDEDAIKVSSSMLSSKGGSLPPDHLGFRWIPDLNTDDARSKKKKFHSANNNLQTVFSEKHPLALVTRRQVHLKGNGYASIYQVGPGKCFNLEHLFFENFPITSSAFLPSEKKFVLGSGYGKHFYVYDMEACQHTRIPWFNPGKPRCMKSMCVINENELVFQEKDEMTLMDTRTWRPVDTMRPPSTMATICASTNGDTLYSYGDKDSKVFIWDLNMRRARGSFLDEGSIVGRSMAVSPNGRYLACGSSTGIVNVYQAREAEMSAEPKPTKVLKQLVTSIDCLKFNSTSEMLSLSSKQLPDAIRIAHFPSMRVFSNFPEAKNNIGKIVSSIFSPNSGYLALSLDTGEVKRIRLHYYDRC